MVEEVDEEEEGGDLPHLKSHKVRRTKERVTFSELYGPSNEELQMYEQFHAARRGMTREQLAEESEEHVKRALAHPSVRHSLRALKSLGGDSSEKSLNEQLRRDMEEGRLGILEGGKPGGVGFLASERINNKFYEHVVYEESPQLHGHYNGM